MAIREPIRMPAGLGWPTALKFAEPAEVIELTGEGRDSIFVVLARFADGRYAIWPQAQRGGLRYAEPELFSSREEAKEGLDALVTLVLDCANTRIRA